MVIGSHGDFLLLVFIGKTIKLNFSCQNDTSHSDLDLAGNNIELNKNKRSSRYITETDTHGDRIRFDVIYIKCQWQIVISFVNVFHIKILQFCGIQPVVKIFNWTESLNKYFKKNDRMPTLENYAHNASSWNCSKIRDLSVLAKKLHSIHTGRLSKRSRRLDFRRVSPPNEVAIIVTKLWLATAVEMIT